MSGKIIDLPANPVTGGPETLPWATQGTTLQPNASQQETGWQPYGVGPPPDYRLENYARLTQSVINERANQTALYLEYGLAEVTLVGVGVGNNRRITIDGTNIDYADQAGDTLADVYAAFVQLINTDPVVSLVAVASEQGGVQPLQIQAIEPGNFFTVTVTSLAGAPGNIVLTTPMVQPIMRTAGDLYYYGDMVIGSPQLDDDGAPSHDARIIWDKSKAAFYAGKATGAQWNDANRGTESVNLGTDNIASGANSVAIGASCTSSGVASISMGTSTASGQNSVAIGNATATAIGAVSLGGQGFTTADATASNAVAISAGAVASAASAVAIGASATASSSSSLALGNSATASAAAAVALHGTAAGAGSFAAHGTASTAHSIAIGESVIANTNTASIAIGYATGSGWLSSTGTGALATGQGASSNTVSASGRGARAHGAPANATLGTVLASGIAADAIGELVTASGDYTEARGLGAIATNRGEIAHSSYNDITLLKPDRGKHQGGQILLQARTTDATLTRLCTNAINGTGANWSPTNYRAMAGEIKVVCKDGAGKYATWFANLMIDKDAGTVTVHNTGPITTGATPPTYNTGAGMNGTSAEVFASGGEVVVRVAGLGATTLRWTAQITWVQAGEDP